ncbi:MAG: hypothetical protein ACRDLD_13305 [Thermoleophilaceae bacterium]
MFGALALVLGAVALIGGGGESAEAAKMRVELQPLSPDQVDVIAYVEGSAAADGPTVGLECVDASGEVVVSARKRWPFRDTDNGALPPHAHEVVPADEASGIVRCRLPGTDGPLEARVR